MTSTTKAFQLPSPMRMLRSLHARLIAADGNQLEHEILIEEVNRETDEIVTCTGESKEIEEEVRHLASVWKDAVKDGKIDPQEARELTREIMQLNSPAHLHTQHLQQLL